MKAKEIQLYYDARMEILIKLRLDAGHSNIKEYATKVDIDASTYAKYETGVTIMETNIFKIIYFNELSMLEFETKIWEVLDRKKNKQLNLTIKDII